MRLIPFLVILVSMLVLAACGDDDSSKPDKEPANDVQTTDVPDQLIGTWESLKEVQGIRSTVTFDADLSVFMDDGCNGGRGSWDVDGTTVTLSELAATMKACEKTGENLLPSKAFTPTFSEDGSELTMEFSDSQGIVKVTRSTK
jgi:heat shock protein HslJ